jgi:membrane fusion protein, multidrug efflux system
MKKGAARASLLFSMALITGCSNSGEQQKGGPGARGGTPEVGFVVVQPTSVAITTELAGRTAPFAEAQVRPQVSGVIQQRSFTEGGLVRRGQTLYQIDPRLFQANTAQAQANVAAAEATAEAGGG